MGTQGSNYLRELIRILIRNLGVLEKEDTSCCGITISQCHAVVEIGRAKEISLNELAEILTLDKSTMSRTINNLVDNGLAVREVHPEDRRYVTITLTDKGSTIFRKIEEGMTEYYMKVFKAIPEDKRQQVIESLKLIIDAVNESK